MKADSHARRLTELASELLQLFLTKPEIGRTDLDLHHTATGTVATRLRSDTNMTP